MELPIWLTAMVIFLSAKKGISARQLGRELGIGKDAAWYMLMRIRGAMATSDPLLLRAVDQFGEPQGKRGLDSSTSSVKKDLRPAIRYLKDRGKDTAMVSHAFWGPWIRPGMRNFIPGGESNWILPRLEGCPIRKRFFAELFKLGSRPGYWSLLRRGVFGQYHQISSRYLHAYIDEYTFRKKHKQESLGLLELLISLLRRPAPTFGTWKLEPQINALSPA